MSAPRAIAAVLLLAFGAIAPALADGAAPRKPKVVSLNPCLDAVLIAVADRDQILALSHFARDPHSSDISVAAATYPIVYETAEEVVALRPDLVLESQHTSPATRAALARMGIATALLSVPTTVVQSLAEIRQIASLIGQPERGEAVIRKIEDALSAATPSPGTPPISALVFQPNGFAAGRGSLIDDMLTRTGFRNVGDRYGLGEWGNVPLERLIADPPQLLLSDTAEPGAQSWAERVANHPALAAIAGRMQRGIFPERLLYCGGPVLIDTAGALASARQRFWAVGK